ncbi:hypothetical zinc ribbon protein [Alphaspiravirus yamagawaense]|uniref:Hypothetical zinc ribbon protein n=1 Tax=Alphaspiravirus yamagawaense TaxID=1157339 RepID=J7QC61_9VIRU|nr:hypothetical zinc ribbon protein [Aeropyrum coil-shaped virus]CCG27829.1 hypothetical zinc ribbon protein [Aeropyrum coil-shaped virus]
MTEDCKVGVRCPVCNTVFFIDRMALAQGEIKCPHCGASLVLVPKDPTLLAQMALYKELSLILKKVERMLGGD